ncbi:MAG: hypothetical protein R3301_08790 [Saprospiraceae bacterium]|nr:hypothetical protein [Saprospiraceae bacterium]
MKTLLTLCSFLLLCLPIRAQFTLLETNEMSLVTYDFGHQYILKHAGRCFHSALDFHKELFDYKPTERISLLIQDFGDYGNAGATAVPRNAISMGLSPFSYAFETSPGGERVYSMMNHELVHVVALDNATKADRFYQKLFLGKVRPTADNPISMFYSYLTSPRRYSPRWYHEGIAAYVETWMGGGIGLAMGSYDEMVFRTRILEDAHIYSAQGLESEGVTTDFQGRTNSYLYGTRFMGYLAYTYGPESIIEWVKRTDGSRRSFVGQFKHVYDKSINKAWKEWIDFERQWQGRNLDTLGAVPFTEATPVTKKAVGSVSYAHYDQQRNRIYVAVNYPGQVPHIAALDLTTGRLRKLVDVKGAALFYVTSLIHDPQDDVLYYTADNDSWRDLHRYDLKTGRTTRLQKDVRTGDLAMNRADRSIWGIKHLNGISTIVRIPRTVAGKPELPPYSTWQQVHTLPYGEDIFDIDISPDGKILSAAVTDLRGNQSLLFYDIPSFETENPVIDTVANFEITSPQSFRFTDDGKYLYGSSYYTGVSNIYRVETETRTAVIVSHSPTGLFRPVVIDDERLFAFQFTSEGFLPVYVPREPVSDVPVIDFLGNVTIEKHHEILQGWEMPVSAVNEINLDSLITFEGPYKPGQLLHLNYGYPIVVGYKDNIGLGYKFHMSDPFNFREFEFSVAYTPSRWVNGWVTDEPRDSVDISNDEQWHISFLAELGPWTIDASYNAADFYDLFGPTQSSRKGLRVGLNYDKSIVYDPPRVLDFRAGLSGFYGLDQSPEFQQIRALGFNTNFFLNLSSSLSYRSLKGSLGGVDAEKGIRTMLWGSVASSAGNYFPRVVGTLDYGIQLPGKHFSLWLRTTAGNSFSDEFNPFTRFGFAAFGNNYVDYQSTRQYRGPFSFAGLPYDAGRSIISQRFAKGTAELVFPPIRFKKLGGFNFFANWMQPSVFGGVLTSSDTGSPDEEWANLGAQLDIRLVTFSLLPSTISIGYAKAWDIGDAAPPGIPKQFDEFMISLKLLQ